MLPCFVKVALENCWLVMTIASFGTKSKGNSRCFQMVSSNN